MIKIKSIYQLLTVISFLLIIIAGEKISGFVFMYLIWLPFGVVNGWSNIFSLKIDRAFIMFIDMIYFILLYFSIYRLLRTYYYKIFTTNGCIINLACILILQLQAILFIPNAKEISSKLTLYAFFAISIINIFIMLRNFISLRKS